MDDGERNQRKKNSDDDEGYTGANGEDTVNEYG